MPARKLRASVLSLYITVCLSAKLLLEKERITGAEFEALFDRDDAKDADADVQSNGAEQSTAENVNAADNAVAEQKAETQTDKQ